MPISDYLKGLRQHVGTANILIPGAAAIIRDGQGKVLLQRRSDNGQWSLPGGATDPGEPPAQTVVREVYEETGLLVRPERLLGLLGGRMHAHPNGDKTEMTISIFACAVIGGELKARDGESLELRFFDPAEMPESPMLRRYPRQLFVGEAAREPYFEWNDAWLELLEP